MRLRLFLICFLLTATGTVWSSDWPNWRGPSRDGASSEKNLPLTWSPTENIHWKLEMPAWSGSTPIIWGDYIFISTAEGGIRQQGRRRRGGRRPGGGRPGGPPGSPQTAGSRRPSPPQTAGSTRPSPPQQQQEPAEEDPKAKQLALWCIDRNRGEVLWKRGLGGGNRQMRKQNMSSPSPVTDGKHVWVMTGTGLVKSFDFQGQEIWSRDIQKDYGNFGLNWGYASSPLLHEGTLYIPVLHGMRTDDPSYVLALDAQTGQTRWKVERPTDAVMESPDSYTTPALLQYDGNTEIVISGGDYVTGHDPNTGEELWRAAGLNPEKRRNYRVVASPVIHGRTIFVPTRRNPLQAFKAGGRGDITESHRLWQSADGPDVPTPVTDGERLYIIGDRGVAHCLNAKSGETVWGPERVKAGIYSASPVLADGRIYATSEEGVTTVLQAGPEFKVLAENQLEGYTLSSPAVSDGQIFIRTEKYLYCIGERSGD